MKISRKHISWIIVAISFGILVGAVMIHFAQPDSYDTELLKSDLDGELQQTKGNIGDTMTSAGAAGQDNPSDSKQINVVTAGGSYSETLVADGNKNILFLGADKGNSLYDTIGVVSIDNKNKKVTIIMLPRDMYVDYSEPVRDALQAAGKAGIGGLYKLNAAHYVGATIGYNGKFKAKSISFLAQVVKEKFSIEIDDYVRISIDGFNQIVDLFGGVDINVPYNMNYDDPAQALSIHLTKGKQHLDGKQAEGFVRFRQGYRVDGTRFDVDRKKNQLTFLKAFFKQHGTISNIDKIPELLKALDKNIMHSVGVGDMLLTYTGIAKDIVNDKYIIEDKNINGEDRMINGMSYVFVN